MSLQGQEKHKQKYNEEDVEPREAEMREMCKKLIVVLKETGKIRREERN